LKSLPLGLKKQPKREEKEVIVVDPRKQKRKGKERDKKSKGWWDVSKELSHEGK